MRTLRRLGLPSAAALAAGLASPSVQAQADARAEARGHHDRGMTEYNLGRFDKAVTEFERAYELDPDPDLLFNLAQAHRRAGSHEKAIFFYERFLLLATKPPAKAVADARRRIEELRRALAERAAEPEPEPEAPVPAPPAGGTPSAAAPPRAPAAPAPGEAPPAGSRRAAVGAGGAEAQALRARAPGGRPPAFALAVGAGVGRLSLSGVNAQPGRTVTAFAIEAARLFELSPFALRVGLLGQYAAFDHDGGAAGVPLTFRFPGLLATGTAGWRLDAATAVGLQIAAGAVWWTGLAKGNGVTLDGAAASGPVPMPAARVGLSAERRFGRDGGVVVRVAPAYLVCFTTSGLSESVSQVRVLQILAELGYAW